MKYVLYLCIKNYLCIFVTVVRKYIMILMPSIYTSLMFDQNYTKRLLVVRCMRTEPSGLF